VKGLSRSAKYYRDNPEARDKHRAYQLEYQKSESNVKKRVELNKYNRKHGTYGNGDGMDAAHHKGKITGYKSASIAATSTTRLATGEHGVLEKNNIFAIWRIKNYNPKEHM
jgi:hypothetical protein